MALSAPRNTIEVADLATMVYIGVAASTTIYQGAMVAVNASGYAVPASATSGLKVVGRAEETVKNTGSAGDLGINVKRGVFLFDNDTTSAVTKAHLMSSCYVKDDGTVTSDATGTSVAGKVVNVSTDGVAVELGLAGVNLTFVEDAVRLAVTGTGVVSGDEYNGYVLTSIANDSTVIINAKTYTKKAATSTANKEFADFAGLVTLAAADDITIIGSSFANIKATKVFE